MRLKAHRAIRLEMVAKAQPGSGDMEEEEEAPAEQFEFALTAVAEEVNAILKALPQ